MRPSISAVHLEPVDRVRVARRRKPERRAGQHRVRRDVDHLLERRASEWATRDAPEIELVRLADVQPIDRVAPVSEPRAHEQHVVVAGRREHPERGRDHRGRLRAEQPIGRHVPRVARITRRAVGRIAERVVVFGDRDDRRRAVHDDRATPARGERRDGVAHEQLHCVRAERRVGEIAQRERASISLGIEQSN